MGKNDTIMREYLSDRSRFADLFNGIFFGGKPVILPEQLQQTDPGYLLKEENSKPARHSQRHRDVKMLLNTGALLRVLAVENQNQVDYTMPFRCMEYDTAEYRKQLQILKKHNRENQTLKSAAERLCGIGKKDRLIPVYTLCLYHGEAPWDGPVTLKEMMDFEEKGQNTADPLQALFAVPK